jgi:hypothetical protein
MTIYGNLSSRQFNINVRSNNYFINVYIIEHYLVYWSTYGQDNLKNR